MSEDDGVYVIQANKLLHLLSENCLKIINDDAVVS
jgi:hypothetical protein